jgi:hypothetical protein
MGLKKVRICGQVINISFHGEAKAPRKRKGKPSPKGKPKGKHNGKHKGKPKGKSRARDESKPAPRNKKPRKRSK